MTKTTTLNSSNTSDRKVPKGILLYDEYLTFQGFYKISSDKMTSEQVLMKCILYVTDWLKKRIEDNRYCDKEEVSFLYDYPSVEAFDSETDINLPIEDKTYFKANSKYDISLLALKSQGAWAIRIREPNNSAQEDADYGDRSFTTDIALRKKKDMIYLAARCACKDSHSHKTAALPFRPVCIRNIAEDPQLRMMEGNIGSDNYEINLHSVDIYQTGRSDKDEYRFSNDLINDPNRQMPIVFCPTLVNNNPNKENKMKQKLAWDLSGNAYVMIESNGHSFESFFQRIERKLKEAKLSVKDIMAKLENHYLYIPPITDGVNYCECFEWIDADPQTAKDKVYAYYVPKLADKSKKASEIKYGNVLFYSELWNAYLDEVLDDADKNIGNGLDNLENIMTELSEQARVAAQEEINRIKTEYKKERESEKQQTKLAIDNLNNKKNDEIARLHDEIKLLKESYSHLDTEKRKVLDRQNDNEALTYMIKWYKKPCSFNDIPNWIRNNMGDFIVVHKKVDSIYKNFDYCDKSKIRDAMIYIYTLEKYLIRDPEISESLNESITNMFGEFELAQSGSDEEKEVADGIEADWHLKYSSESNVMFRIYYHRNTDNGKLDLISIKKHAE